MNLNSTIILDTDIGFDPDDLFALFFLHKLNAQNFKLLITANEVGGKRAIFARDILNKLGNTHTKICVGSNLGLDKFTIDPLIKDLPTASIDASYLEVMKEIIDTNESVTFIGIGGFTNLANFIQKFPEQAKKMKIYIMGGAVNYERYFGWVEYNVKIDIDSTRRVIESGCDISLVMAQTTHNPIYEVDQNHIFYKKLSESSDPVLKTLYEHCKLWFEKRGHGTSMHDPLTVAAALGYDFVKFNTSKILVDEKGIFHINDSGSSVEWSEQNSNAGEFMNFLSSNLFEM